MCISKKQEISNMSSVTADEPQTQVENIDDNYRQSNDISYPECIMIISHN